MTPQILGFAGTIGILHFLFDFFVGGIRILVFLVLELMMQDLFSRWQLLGVFYGRFCFLDTLEISPFYFLREVHNLSSRVHFFNPKIQYLQPFSQFLFFTIFTHFNSLMNSTVVFTRLFFSPMIKVFGTCECTKEQNFYG